MSYTPSAAAQALAAQAGNNMATLATPLTGLQTSIAAGNLAPSAYLDALFAAMAATVFAPIAWNTLTLTNSWVVTSGAAAAAYYKDAFGIVHVSIDVTNSSSSAAIATLPVGYRPRNLFAQDFIGSVSGGGLQITTAGVIQPGTAGTRFFGELSFPAFS